MTNPDPDTPTRIIAPVEQRVDAIQAAFEERGLKRPSSSSRPITWSRNTGCRRTARASSPRRGPIRPSASGCSPTAATRSPSSASSMPRHHRHLVVLENTPTVHNVICCTQCSCTAYTIIGLPPDWYKDFEYRARVVRESRTVLREMGLDLPPEIEIRVWDTTADTRYMVLPMRPPGTDGWSEEKLAPIVTKDAHDRRRAPLAGPRPWTACTTSAASRASAACATRRGAGRSTSRGKSAPTRSIRSRSSSACSTWTSTAMRSSAWSRATISRPATTSDR